MDGFDIASERIKSAATGVDGVGAALQREIVTMDGLLGDIRAGWQSTSAAPRFAAAMEGYLDDARTLAQALISHGASLSSTAQAFDQAEETVAAATPAVVS